VRDRVVATTWGYKAVMLLAEGKGNRVVAMDGDRYMDMDIHEALKMKKDFDLDMYRMFSALTFLDKSMLF